MPLCHALFTVPATRQLCSFPQDTLNNNSLGKKHSWQERVSRSSSPLKTGESQALSRGRSLSSQDLPLGSFSGAWVSEGQAQSCILKCPDPLACAKGLSVTVVHKLLDALVVGLQGDDIPPTPCLLDTWPQLGWVGAAGSCVSAWIKIPLVWAPYF